MFFLNCQIHRILSLLRLGLSFPQLFGAAVLISFLPSPPSLHVLSDVAVQEERQRNREREGELEFSVSVNEEMPVEKILAAETAVEQKTELHSEGVSAGNSVRKSSATGKHGRA